jgi:hypothetical protein
MTKAECEDVYKQLSEERSALANHEHEYTHEFFKNRYIVGDLQTLLSKISLKIKSFEEGNTEK